MRRCACFSDGQDDRHCFALSGGVLDLQVAVVDPWGKFPIDTLNRQCLGPRAVRHGREPGHCAADPPGAAIGHMQGQWLAIIIAQV